MTHEIRTLTPVDATALFEVRRDGLIDAPLAFLSTPTESRLSVDGIRDMLTRDVVFGAGGDRLLGMAGVYTEDREKTAHKAHLWGMYVRPEARGRGLAGALLARVIAHARSLDGVRWLHLGVSETAEHARRCYESAGFATWGVEPEALCHNGRCVAELHMVLKLE